MPEDLQAVREILIEAVQTHRDEVPALQYRLIHPETEEIIWVEVNAKLVYDDEGKPQRMFGMLQNITGRKAAENEKNQLLEREQAQRLAAEQSKLEVEQARNTAEQELTERKLAEQALGAWTDNPLPQEVRSPWLRYGMAIVATILAVLARTLLDSVVGDFVQYTTLFAAVAFSVWYGGTGPALISAILGYVGISWLVLGWEHFIGPTAGSWIGLAMVLFSSTIIIALGGAMRRRPASCSSERPSGGAEKA